MNGIDGNIDFEYKGNKYGIQNIVEMKDPSTGKWLKAVHYMPWHNSTKRYVRELDDFIKKFKSVDCADNVQPNTGSEKL